MIYFPSRTCIINGWAHLAKARVVNHSAELALLAAKRLEEILQFLYSFLLPDHHHSIALEYLILRPDARDDPPIT